MNKTNQTTIQLAIANHHADGMDGHAVATNQQQTSAAISSTEVVAIANIATDTARPKSTAADSQWLKNCESSKESDSSQKLIWAVSNSPIIARFLLLQVPSLTPTVSTRSRTKRSSEQDADFEAKRNNITNHC